MRQLPADRVQSGPSPGDREDDYTRETVEHDRVDDRRCCGPTGYHGRRRSIRKLWIRWQAAEIYSPEEQAVNKLHLAM